MTVIKTSRRSRKQEDGLEIILVLPKKRSKPQGPKMIRNGPSSHTEGEGGPQRAKGIKEQELRKKKTLLSGVFILI